MHIIRKFAFTSYVVWVHLIKFFCWPLLYQSLTFDLPKTAASIFFLFTHGSYQTLFYQLAEFDGGISIWAYEL